MTDNDSKNYGMDINGVVALEGSSDSPKDSPYGLDFDYRLVGSLSHLHLIGSPISVEDNIINVELGNISPIVMARMDRNDDVRNGTYTLDSFYTGGTVRNITEFVDSTTKSVNKETRVSV